MLTFYAFAYLSTEAGLRIAMEMRIRDSTTLCINELGFEIAVLSTDMSSGWFLFGELLESGLSLLSAPTCDFVSLGVFGHGNVDKSYLSFNEGWVNRASK